MKAKIGLIAMCLLLVLGPAFAASGLSVQFKSSTPGVAGEQSAEIIYDIVNTDMTHKIKGFMWCQSPDNTVVSSSYGASSGSGAQYVSPMFTIDVGPSQQSIALTLSAAKQGTYDAKCYVKYIPLKEEIVGEATVISYLKMNGEYIANPADGDYRELRLDKYFEIEAKPFVINWEAITGNATVEELAKNPLTWVIGIGVIAVVVIAYLSGKASRP